MMFFFRIFTGFLFLGMISCGRIDPGGQFSGDIKDWIHEVFDGSIMSSGEEGRIRLILRQTPDGMLTTMTFEHPKVETVSREGKWEVGDGERKIYFDDDREPSEYFLIKRGIRFAFQTKAGLSNDDGSPVLLMRNEGLSRKASYPINLAFGDDENVVVTGGATDLEMKGEWMWAGSSIVVTAKLPAETNAIGRDEDLETYKYFLQWDEKDRDMLLLEKMVVMRPFRKQDGAKRQSWMSSLTFEEKPKLRAKASL